MKRISRLPFYLILLPVFFVLHGFLENYNPGLVKDALILIPIYAVAGVILAGFFYILFRNIYKAGLMAFFLLAYNLFFGSTHDFLKSISGNSFFIRYTFILPFMLLIFAALGIYLKKTKKNFSVFGQYLNMLFVILILLDGFLVFNKLSTRQRLHEPDYSSQLKPCDSCDKPDIHLIVADEYAGKKELLDIFGFDNHFFETELRNRGFHVVDDCRANYNATVYSMGSMLNLDYVRHLESTTVNHRDLLYCRELINRNSSVDFFLKSGYRFNNFSYFEIAGKANPFHNLYYPTKRQLITAQTFLQRFKHDIGYNFSSKKDLKEFVKHNMYNNIKTENMLLQSVTSNKNGPSFTYTHFSMPHHPYYFDSAGREAQYDPARDNYILDKPSYIQYLVFTNRKLLTLVDSIRSASAKPPVIILMSDHGFRQFKENVNQQYYFMNLNAVYLPSGNYRQFYDGMTLVNQFRIILNAQFGQKLPLLKDSTTFLNE